jgi:hypothetical protein
MSQDPAVEIPGTKQALRRNPVSTLKTKKPDLRAFLDGGYWTRTSDRQLVDLRFDLEWHRGAEGAKIPGTNQALPL